MTDPADNQSTYNFQGIYETERQVASLETVSTCYNGSPSSSCNTTPVSLPIMQVTATTTLGTLLSKTNTNYSSYGIPWEFDQYAFGSGAPGGLVKKTVITYGTYFHPSDIQVQDGVGTVKAHSTYSYDSSGNLTGEIVYTGGTPATISRTFTPGSYGVLTAATDFKANPTTYSNFTCNGAFPQTISAGGLSSSETWDCNGGVITSVKDPNNQTTTYSFDTTHNFWRVSDIAFPDGGAITWTYNDAPPSIVKTTKLSSTENRTDVVSLDGLGRVYQTELSSDPDGATYVVTAYDDLGRLQASRILIGAAPAAPLLIITTLLTV